MVETAITTTMTRTTTQVPATQAATIAAPAAATTRNTAAAETATPTVTTTTRIRRIPRQNDETTRGIFNLKQIVFLLLLPLILFAVFLKHLLDYLFGLAAKEKDVSGKVALITGAGGGLGREIAIELAKKGCKVAIVDLHSKDCYETVDLIAKLPRTVAKVYKTDVSSPRELQLMALKVEKELGPVEILVNNTSIMPMSSTPQQKNDEIERIISVNLASYIMTTKEFLPKMVTRKSGHVVSIASLAGLIPLPGAGIYTATKYGIIGFMESLRAELRLSDCDYIRTTIAHAYMMKTCNELHLLNDSGLAKSYPGRSTSYVAAKIVKGILLNEWIVYVPKIFALSVWLRRLLPTKWQDYTLLKFYNFDRRSAHQFFWK